MNAVKTKPRTKSAPSRKPLEEHHQRRLARLCPKAPFVLRITEWKDYPSPVLVISERSFQEERPKPLDWGKTSKGGTETIFDSAGTLQERGHVYGESFTRIRPVLKSIAGEVTDDAGVPLGLDQYFVRGANAAFRGNLPLDNEAGCKLTLIFKLSDRVKDMDRVELIARRVERFTREEAAYWLSRILHFGPEAGRWAAHGMRIMLGGEPGDKAIPEMLAKLQSA